MIVLRIKPWKSKDYRRDDGQDLVTSAATTYGARGSDRGQDGNGFGDASNVEKGAGLS